MAEVFGLDWGKASKLAGYVDFFRWKGHLYARIYPKHIRQPGTPRQRHTWDGMRFARDAWRALPHDDVLAWRWLCVPPQHTGRDYFMRILLKGYATPGLEYNDLHASFIPATPGSTRIRIEKTLPSIVMVSVMTETERRSLLQWSTGVMCIRGARLIRRHILRDNTIFAKKTFFIMDGESYAEYTYSEGDPAYFLTAKPISETEGGFGRLGLFDLRTGKG